MNKAIGVIAVIALVADIALFLGIGFGTGVLSLASSSNPNTNYVFSDVNVGTSWGDGISYHVDLATVNQSGQPMTTALLSGGASTALTFDTIFYSKGDCLNQHEPVFAPGIGADYGFYILTFAGQKFSGTIDGQSFATASSLSIAANTSNVVAYCASGSGDQPFPSTPTVEFQHTLVLNGRYGIGTLSVSFYAYMTFCDGTSGSGAVCSAARSAGAALGPPGSTTLLAPYVSTASTTVQSGYGTVSVNNPGNLVGNGGTISITVATGYAGPSGWTVSLLCPFPRTNGSGGCPGGQNDLRFGAATVGNDCSGCPVSWTVPSGTSQASNISGWNTWEVELTNGLFHIGYAPVTINIQPPTSPSTPPMPGITFSNSGQFYYPTPGASTTINVYANVSSASGPISSISLWVYYLTPGQNPVNEPGCGSVWITTGCPFGFTLGASQVQSNGANGLIGSFTFTVSPPSGATQIGVLAESFATGQQGSPIASYLIQVTPANCNAGSPGCQTKTGLSTWNTLGPILLSIALVLASFVAFVFVPGTPRYVLVAIGPALVVAFYVLSLWPLLFHIGGPLG